MNDLIYDRTAEDAAYAEQHQSSENFLKGAYNYTDLNRVEEWCEYLETELGNRGYVVSITTKTDWTDDDFPTELELERIRSNIYTLKAAFYSYTNVPNSMAALTWEKANDIEKVLDEMYHLMWGMEEYYVYSGVSNAGQPRVFQNRFRHFFTPLT